MHTTKIVCTLGPASESRETVATLADAGMSLARFNASHGSTDERAALIKRVRDVDATIEASVATLLDLPGPRSGPHRTRSRSRDGFDDRFGRRRDHDFRDDRSLDADRGRRAQ